MGTRTGERTDICEDNDDCSMLLAAIVLCLVPLATCRCHGSHTYHATGTGYYPADDPIEGGFLDMRGHKLHTLQDFLEGHASYVSVAMDNRAGIAYGTRICIPEMDAKYNRHIVFEVVDTGSAFYGKGHSRIDICVRNRALSYDDTINGRLTLVFP
ncbi:uncharacterized protein LOC121389504 [Gigantopelta aegis]|uniref:uncharacterized protein LOC121389504 n=1 Tax=Gigantopelta aegis TaxID=1735272 RepID=UPI001B88B4D2|nr:uncharacterized protein LOC121389504 [Gigantopelta aegis]